eukprot:g3383.t1
MCALALALLIKGSARAAASADAASGGGSSGKGSGARALEGEVAGLLKLACQRHCFSFMERNLLRAPELKGGEGRGETGPIVIDILQQLVVTYLQAIVRPDD